MNVTSRNVGAAALILGLVVFDCSCTVVTSCPTDNNGPPAGGATGNGGNSAAGNGATGNGGDGSVPIPTGTWQNVTSNLAGLPSECGNLAHLSAKPDENLIIAGVALLGLYATDDGGEHWSQLGTGKGSDAIKNRLSAIVYDPDDTTRFWESGLYNGPGVYETKNSGDTFQALPDTGANDLVAVDFSDSERRTLLIGAHEQEKGLRRSTDGGESWEDISSNLPGKTNCTHPMVIDATTYLVGCGGYGGGPVGIYRTTNGGKSWAGVTESGGQGTPLRASDGSIYWESPMGGSTRSVDNGLNWTDTDPGKVATSLVELPDGRLAGLGSQYVVVSADFGKTWTPATSALPYDPHMTVGVVYGAQQKAFFIWRSTCTFNGDPVPDDAVMRYDFDFETD